MRFGPCDSRALPCEGCCGGGPGTHQDSQTGTLGGRHHLVRQKRKLCLGEGLLRPPRPSLQNSRGPSAALSRELRSPRPPAAPPLPPPPGTSRPRRLRLGAPATWPVSRRGAPRGRPGGAPADSRPARGGACGASSAASSGLGGRGRQADKKALGRPGREPVSAAPPRRPPSPGLSALHLVSPRLAARLPLGLPLAVPSVLLSLCGSAGL